MFKRVAKLEEIQEGKLYSINAKFINIAITLIDGEVIAFEDSCTHDGEEISSGKIENNCIVCPRHLAKFNLKTGEALTMPATEPLQILPTRIEDGYVEVEISN
ncbi:MAG: Rieske 2Fe-2S domain-containing protein [Leptospiraceae bacterium]|nr:Rieske 2Fe-2S domain-containing protein [Leptospiraceae bacterium]